MGLLQRLGEFFTGEPSQVREERYSARNGGRTVDARGGHAVREEVARDDDAGWRAVANPRATYGTEHDELEWRALLDEAYRAYSTNPLAYAIVEQQVNFILGGGARVVAKDKRVQAVVDDFWGDPANDMDARIYSIVTELCIFGEQFIRFFVGAGGRVVIRQMDPGYVAAIETAPADVETPLAYLYQPSTLMGAPRTTEGEWIPADEVAHFTINKVSNALRGRSDLATLLPWLRRYRDWLLDRARQNKLKGTFVYDVTVEGGEKAQLDAMRAELAKDPPQPGAVLIHSEKEKWAAVQPMIGAGDVRDDGRAMRLMIAAGAGIPEHYLAEGGNANRATAKEMGLPAIKRMQRRQEYVRQMLERIVRRVVAEARAAGRLGERRDLSLAVQFEELSPSTLDEQALAAKTFADALALAEERGWCTTEQARRVWWRFAGDPEEATRARFDGDGAPPT